jgi:hypothetical protein
MDGSAVTAGIAATARFAAVAERGAQRTHASQARGSAAPEQKPFDS